MVNVAWIRQTEEILIVLSGAPEGKAICYTNVNGPVPGFMDTFQFNLSWDSINKLKQESSKESFEWDISDKSLHISGDAKSWTLQFPRENPPSAPITVTVPLTAYETAQLKKALF